MEKDLIVRLNKTFEESAYTQNEVEYWLARDLQKLLEYEEWRNFLKVIEKAKTACSKSGHKVSDHFVEVNKMVQLGSGSQRQIDDVMLTRYACYLIAQNGHRVKATEGSEDTEVICPAGKITKKFVDKMLGEKAEKFTCLDGGFNDNDQLKTNRGLQMEGAKVEFKVIFSGPRDEERNNNSAAR